MSAVAASRFQRGVPSQESCPNPVVSTVDPLYTHHNTIYESTGCAIDSGPRVTISSATPSTHALNISSVDRYRLSPDRNVLGRRAARLISP